MALIRDYYGNFTEAKSASRSWKDRFKGVLALLRQGQVLDATDCEYECDTIASVLIKESYQDDNSDISRKEAVLLSLLDPEHRDFLFDDDNKPGEARRFCAFFVGGFFGFFYAPFIALILILKVARNGILHRNKIPNSAQDLSVKSKIALGLRLVASLLMSPILGAYRGAILGHQYSLSAAFDPRAHNSYWTTRLLLNLAKKNAHAQQDSNSSPDNGFRIEKLIALTTDRHKNYTHKTLAISIMAAAIVFTLIITSTLTPIGLLPLIFGANSLATGFLVGLPTAGLAGVSAGIVLLGTWGVLQLGCWLVACGVGGHTAEQGKGSEHDLIALSQTEIEQGDSPRTSRNSQSSKGSNTDARKSLISPGLHAQVVQKLGDDIPIFVKRRASQVLNLPDSDGLAGALFPDASADSTAAQSKL